MVARVRPALIAAWAAIAFLVGSGCGPFGLPASAGAEILSARVAVRGMTCNICAGTVERRLKRVACIVTASVDLEHGLAQLSPRPGQHFDGRRVLKAIHDAGFTPGDIYVVARGQLVTRNGIAYLELVPGDLVILSGATGPPSLPDLPGAGQTIRVSGRLADPSGDSRASVGICVERAALATAP